MLPPMVSISTRGNKSQNRKTVLTLSSLAWLSLMDVLRNFESAPHAGVVKNSISLIPELSNS